MTQCFLVLKLTLSTDCLKSDQESREICCQNK